MKQISLSGIIKIETPDNFTRIKLLQPDGLKIDLISRFQEAIQSFNSSVQVGYYLSDRPCTKQEMQEGFLENISGSVNADYEANEYRYSSWTHGCDYDSVLKIGGHDLYSELMQEQDRFIIIELNFA